MEDSWPSDLESTRVPRATTAKDLGMVAVVAAAAAAGMGMGRESARWHRWEVWGS